MEKLFLVIVVGGLIFGMWKMFFNKKKEAPVTPKFGGGSFEPDKSHRHDDGSLAPPSGPAAE